LGPLLNPESRRLQSRVHIFYCPLIGVAVLCALKSTTTINLTVLWCGVMSVTDGYTQVCTTCWWLCDI